MTAGFSDVTGNKAMDEWTSKTAWTGHAAFFIGLATTVPTQTSAGTEVTGGSYAREEVVASGWDASASQTTQLASGQDITFTTATANWGTIQALTFHSLLTGGEYLGWATLTTVKTINSGDTAKIVAGASGLQVKLQPT